MGTTETFLAAAESVADLVDSVPPESYDAPALGEWDVRSLIGHTSRALTTVLEYLQRPADWVSIPDSAGYLSQPLPEQAHAGIAQRGREAAAAMGEQPAAAFRNLIEQVRTELGDDQHPGEMLVTTRFGTMSLDAYLPTRTFELVIHGSDLSRALDLDFHPPVEAIRESMRLMADVAVERGQAERVLRALAGRASLPQGYTLLS